MPQAKSPAEILFDRGLEVVGLEPRGENETIEAYIDRPGWGPNTRFNFQRAYEAAQVLDRVQTMSSISSARDHANDPNPPDAHPRPK